MHNDVTKGETLIIGNSANFFQEPKVNDILMVEIAKPDCALFIHSVRHGENKTFVFF